MHEDTSNDSRLLNRIYETTPMAIVVVNRDGQIRLANLCAEKVLRLAKGEISGRCYDAPEWTITDFDGNPFPADALPFSIVQRTLAPVGNIRHAITHPNGEKIYLRIDAIPLLDESGAFDGIVAYLEDISESVKEAARHAEQEATLRSIFRAAPVGIGMVKQRHLTWMNAKLLEMCGYQEAELIGQSARILYPTDEDFEYVGTEKYRQIAAHGTGTVETKWQRKDGTIIDVLLSSTPLDMSDISKGVTFSALDISVRKQLEKQLRHVEKMRAIGQLAGGIAHDFNNQLAGIMGFADLLNDELATSPGLQRYTSEIISAATRASDLTFQLLAFAQKGKFLSVSVDIHRMVAEVVALLGHSIHKNISIEQHLQASPATIKGDPSQIQNALLNLALNARDAMPDGGILTFSTSIVTLEKSTGMSSSQELGPGRYIRISVADTGTGISEQDQLRIFEPFFSLNSDNPGLGLAAVYGTCQNHSGAVDVVSTLNEGSTFSVYLPVEPERDAITETVSTRNVDDARSPQSQSVMIVEDESVVREMLCSIIEAMGLRAVTCVNGADALQKYKADPTGIDLVILDMVMPVKGGAATFFELRQINPDAKVIISSGYTIDGDAQKMLSNGALGFIQKPFRRSDLQALV
ncbi:MAG: PAS domain S-box protein, partial [Deltaproteobacteria bacterium]|nr:PAS domain S-box protein [Deltaproteobacteria bacterium]